MVSRFLKHLIVLSTSVLFSAVITFVVLPQFMVARLCSCHDTDTAQEEFSTDLKITDYLAGSIDWNPPLYYQQKLASLSKTPTDQIGTIELVNTYVGLGKLDGAIKTTLAAQKASSPNDALALERHVAKLYFFKWAQIKFASNEFGKKSAASYAKYIKNRPSNTGQAEIEYGLVKMKLGALFYGDYESRTSEWENLLVTWGHTKVRDVILQLILEMGQYGDPDLFSNLARIGSGTEEEALGSRIMLLSKYGFHFYVDSQNLYVTDDLKSNGGFQINHNANAAVNELAAWGKKYRENRTNFMLTKLKSGSHPDTDPHFWDGYKALERPDLKKYGTWVPKFLRDFSITNFGPIPVFAGLTVLCFAILTATISAYTKLEARKKLQLRPGS